MKNSTHIFICALITLTVALLNFIFDSPKGGWVLVILTAIEAIMGLLALRNEKKKGL